MQISPVSNSQAIYNSQPAQAPASNSSSQGPVDTVHLSPAAQAHISGDVDHDGDSH